MLGKSTANPDSIAKPTIHPALRFVPRGADTGSFFIVFMSALVPRLAPVFVRLSLGLVEVVDHPR